MNPAYRTLYQVIKPWYYFYDAAQSRCTGRNAQYHLKGIKFLMTAQEVAFLWHRDKADQLQHPSLDRINTKGHYTIANCRFMELAENKSRQKYQWKDPQSRGACWDKVRKQWQAHIWHSGRTRFLGRFPTKAEAQAAYNKEARMLYGQEALMA